MFVSRDFNVISSILAGCSRVLWNFLEFYGVVAAFAGFVYLCFTICC